MPVNYIETGSLDPCYNLAFEQYLLENKTDGKWLMLWQNANTVVIGMNQNTAEEINADFVKAHNITVVRRMTGGGAVYHDLGNLNYSFITDTGDKASLSIEQFSRPVCRALESLGLRAAVGGRNDIIVEGKKVSGVAQRIYKNRILHHGTLLFRSDADMIAGALNADPSKFESKSSKSVKSRVGNISEFLPDDMSFEQFREAIRHQLSLEGAVVRTLREDELEKIRKNADEKYRSWEWTYGRSPKYTFKNKARFPGGSIEVRLFVEGGIIKEAAFSGDYMAVTDCADAVRALSGVKFSREDVLAALSAVDTESMFGAITAENIADVIFSLSKKS